MCIPDEDEKGPESFLPVVLIGAGFWICAGFILFIYLNR